MRGMSLFVGDDGAVTGARVARLEVMEVIYWGTGERSENTRRHGNSYPGGRWVTMRSEAPG